MSSGVIATSGITASDQVSLSFQLSIFSLDTLKRAAIKFSSDCVFEFTASEAEAVLKVTFRHPMTEEKRSQFIDKIRIEILDQDLREKIAAESEVYRNLILANVFSKTSFSKLSEE